MTIFVTHVGASINVPFTITGGDGQPDTTTMATVFSECADDIVVGFLPGNNRVVFVDGKGITAPVKITISAFVAGAWFHQIFQVQVNAGPNLGGIGAPGPASAEYGTPVR